MTAALFLAPVAGQGVGSKITISGAEGRHAGTVKRIEIGEELLVSDGKGAAVKAVAVQVTKSEVVAEVVAVIEPEEPRFSWTVIQGLPKSDRQNLAVELATELGASEIILWQAERSISRWDGPKCEKGVAKLQACAIAATKQSRRFLIPKVSFIQGKELAQAVESADLILVLHENATRQISQIQLPQSGKIAVIVGPEGGISPNELDVLWDAGAVEVVISDGILRTSTAGGVALAQLQLLATLGQNK